MKKKKVNIGNPVAKYCEFFNKPKTHKDKTKYSRKEKYKKYDDSSSAL